jgi:hypothetical protein
MKTIQITINPELLRRIGDDEESKMKGRSAFLRKAVRYYLEQKKLRSITEQYRSGYTREPSKNDDLNSWEEEQVWPKTSCEAVFGIRKAEWGIRKK